MQIAKALGVDNSTVSAYRKKMVDNGEVLESNTSKGADGKKYPRKVKRKSLVSVFNPNRAERLETKSASPTRADKCNTLASMSGQIDYC